MRAAILGGDRLRPVLPSMLLGGLAAMIALLPATTSKLLAIAALLAIPVSWWAIGRAERWLLLLLCSLVVLPPLPIPMGDSAPHPSLLFGGLAVFAAALRPQYWLVSRDSLTRMMLIYTSLLLLSIGCAALISGLEIALGSLIRVVLFAISPFVFFCTVNATPFSCKRAMANLRLLFRVAVLGALFACVDFYFQFPAPAAFGPQFIWLEQGVFRRAQGVFYEASTLGNCCAFFLVMILVALCRSRKDISLGRLELIFGGMVLLIALVLSYSRGSLLNLTVAAIVLAVLQRKQMGKPALLVGISGALCMAIIYASFPAFAESYLSRLAGSLKFIWTTPDGVLSGRLNAWYQLGGFLGREPWRLCLGIGYKTLPYSDVAGSPVITDNTYLSVLVETGIAGLGAFLLLNYRLLQSALKASRSQSGATAFFGTWIFCFWIGELLQMLSGDIFTYWRVLPLYFWVFALAHRDDPSQRPVFVGTN